MSYQAVICKLENIRSHSNADRLRLAEACNSQVIVGLEEQEGTLGVFFDSDGCLSHDMCHFNNLYSKKELNADQTQNGYFGNSRRIKAQNFRGEKSYGFWCPIEFLSWTGVDLSTLKEGDLFTQLNDKLVCKKYVNPKTLRTSLQNKKYKAKEKVKKRFTQLKEHFDTGHLRREINQIPVGSILYISEKCHGTSARTGNLIVEFGLTKFQQWWNHYLKWTGKEYVSESKYMVISGTRRVVLDPAAISENGYYSGKTFRIDIHNSIKEFIPAEITVYYEICGYDETGKPIMNPQDIEKINDKKLKKEVKKYYGNKMDYSYGCDQDTQPKEKRYSTFVYRATVTNVTGDVFELSCPQLKELCEKIGMKYVPELEGPFIYDGDKKSLLERVEKYLDLPSIVDDRHIREGVCIRIEPPNGKMYILKEKGHLFKILEGIVKEDPNSIDLEEVEDLIKEGEKNETISA